VIRRIGNTPVTPFLGGGAAVLLQVAHPLVAAGVTAHSDYDARLWYRLARTMRALYLVTFGTRAEAEEAADAVRAVHAFVHGVTAEDLGPFPAGTAYSANDPELMLWVHATLVHSSLAAYERFEHRLSRADQACYYRDMAGVAELFGTPPEVLPPTLDDFDAYLAAKLAGPEITVTRPARAIARVVLEAPLPTPMRVLAPAHRLATAALLPSCLREEYGLRLPPAPRPLLGAAGLSVRIASWPMVMLAGLLRPPFASAA
jgi:uncharacterized protein (DUF2236 family)